MVQQSQGECARIHPGQRVPKFTDERWKRWGDYSCAFTPSYPLNPPTLHFRLQVVQGLNHSFGRATGVSGSELIRPAPKMPQSADSVIRQISEWPVGG